MEAPKYTMVLDRESSHQSVQQQEFPQQETPYKDPHQGELGLQGSTTETTPNQNSFGRWVDQHLLTWIPEGIEKLLDREGDLQK